MTPEHLLSQLADELEADPSLWTQRPTIDQMYSSGEVCTWTGLYELASEGYPLGAGPNSRRHTLYAALSLLGQALGYDSVPQPPERVQLDSPWGEYTRKVWNWNDAPERTVGEVIFALRCAAGVINPDNPGEDCRCSA